MHAHTYSLLSLALSPLTRTHTHTHTHSYLLHSHLSHAHTHTHTHTHSHTHSHTLTQAWLAGANPCPNIQTGVDSAVESCSKAKIKEALDSNFQGPQQHMKSYGEVGGLDCLPRERGKTCHLPWITLPPHKHTHTCSQSMVRIQSGNLCRCQQKLPFLADCQQELLSLAVGT